MSITKLKTDFKDDIIDVATNAHRKYKLTSVANEADTYTFEDMTTYIQKGTEFNGAQANATNGAVNQLIDIAETDNANIDKLLDGTLSVKKANTATTATSATTATRSTNSDKTQLLETPRKINGVTFDGSKDINIVDSTKLPKEKDFILINQQQLTFNGRSCDISDSRITRSSLADIYFTESCVTSAEEAEAFIETYDGKVTIYVNKTPSTTLVASIRIRSV